MMNNTERVREYLSVGTATRMQIAEALGISPRQVTFAIQGLQSRAEATTVSGGKGGKEAVYALAITLPAVTSQSLVAAALANEPELARIWR